MGYGMLIIQQAGRPDRFEPLTQQIITVGRASECAITLDYPAVSRRHLRLEWAGEAYQVVDLASAHGTMVDGRRIDRPVRLRPHGRIWLGDALGNGVSLTYIPDGVNPLEEGK
jgi:pSer/pThr/pTyr-binding forkhead associated (FHA) protein